MSTSRSTLSALLSKRAAMPSKADALEPDKCTTMAEVRRGVDVTDAALIALLARRFAYIDAAARIKTDRQSVRDEARKAEVLGNVGREAAAAGLDPERLRAVWDVLVEQSIAHEFLQWDRVREG